MRRVELTRLRGRCETLIQPTLKALNLIFTRLEVVAWPVYINYELMSFEHGHYVI